jgi:hypothetical protein
MLPGLRSVFLKALEHDAFVSVIILMMAGKNPSNWITGW